MAEIKDIREVRKKRKRKKLIKSLSFFLVFVLVLTLVIANRDKFAEIDLVTAVHTPLFGGKDKAGFPVTITQGVPQQVLQKNGGLAVLTDSALLTYKKSGRKTGEFPHAYSNPGVCVSDKTQNFLLYDKGGTSFQVMSGGDALYKKEVATPIQLAGFSRAGMAAVIRGTESHATQLSVFDESSNEMYKWMAANEYAVAFDFAPDSKGAAVCTVRAENGELVSTVYLLDFSKDSEAFQVELPGEMAVSVRYASQNEIAVVTDKAATVLTDKGRQKGRFAYQDESLLSYCYAGSERLLVLTGSDSVDAPAHLTVIGMDGKVDSQGEAAANVTAMAADDSNIYLLYKDSVRQLDRNQKRSRTVNLQFSGSGMTASNNKAYILGQNNLFMVDFSTLSYDK